MKYLNNNDSNTASINTPQAIRIKICGMRRLEDIEMANELLPDYIGFIFVKDRRRYVPPEEAVGLKTALNRQIKAVGVFVDEEPETVAGLANSGIIDVIQLHGSEDETYISKLRALTDRPIIKCFVVKDNTLADGLEQSSADMILIDAGAGDGKTFDWKILKSIRRPYFLAGGLDPDNVSDAVNMLHPHGVDVSSGVETDGFKDPDKMRAFIKAIRLACGAQHDCST